MAKKISLATPAIVYMKKRFSINESTLARSIKKSFESMITYNRSDLFRSPNLFSSAEERTRLFVFDLWTIIYNI